LTYVVLQSFGLRTTPVAGLIVVHPGVQFKPVEGNALPADTDFSDSRPYFGVEAIAIHAEVMRGVA